MRNLSRNTFVALTAALTLAMTAVAARLAAAEPEPAGKTAAPAPGASTPTPASNGKPVVTIVATVPETDETAKVPAVVKLTRTGDLARPLTIELDVKGDTKPKPAARAKPAPPPSAASEARGPASEMSQTDSSTLAADQDEVAHSVTVPAGVATAEMPIVAHGDFEKQGTRTLSFTIKPAAAYQVGSASTAKIQIKDVPPELFVAALRPTHEADDSTAYGTATLLLAPDHSRARVTVSHANLSSPLVSSHLKLAEPGQEGSYLINFPAGQQVSFEWAMQPTGQFTSDALRAALEHGQIYAALDTKNHPTGELRGNFIHVTGSEKFQPPGPPPKFTLTNLTPQDVARFFEQTTFGPKKTDIDEFLHPVPQPNQPPPKPLTFEGWISEQMSLPASSHLQAMRDDYRAHIPTTPRPRISNANRQIAWWQIALQSPDQLRQRVAFALSEIFVVSDVNDTVANWPEGAAVYYDMLARDAFGNFRDLLEDVTRSPIMGAYLSALKSPKADEKKGTSADENYAREVMQLFTIGLNELQPDGTYKLNKDGLPIPTYDQGTIVETAKIFTGMGFYSPEPRPNFFGARANFFQPMMLYPEQHDDGPKTLVNGIKVPAKQGAEADLKQTLDALFNHPNTGPFICRQLIQRLVTSNPSPGYVYRVSQVFAKNGHGVRGDLGAVIRAILLDYEARSPDMLRNFSYGKMKEPLLQATALLRAFDGTTPSGRYFFPNPEGSLGQAALRSPTVFNFFEPDYVLPGRLAAAGLRAPEYQIFTDSTAISIPNQLRNFIYSPAKPTENQFVLKLDPLLALASKPDELIDYLDLVFCANELTKDARKVLTISLEKMGQPTSDLDKVRSILDLVVTSPAASVQR